MSGHTQYHPEDKASTTTWQFTRGPSNCTPTYTSGHQESDHLWQQRCINSKGIFGAFADKNTGVVYNDMTGNFPFVSIDGSVCYFIMYHYKSISILATPINGMTDNIIFKAYKKNFKMLKSKGFKVKLNIMDNQATKHINKILANKNANCNYWNPTTKG